VGRSVRVGTKLSVEPADVVIVWMKRDERLDNFFRAVERKIKQDGALCCIFPKQLLRLERKFSYDWDAMVRSGLNTQLVDNKTLTFSEEEYGTRLVVRKDLRS